MTDMCKIDPSCSLCLAAVSHNFCFVQCQNFHSASFLAFERLAKNWFSSLPSERRHSPIFWSCFSQKWLFVLLQLFHSKSIGAFVVVIQTGKGDFTPLRYFVAKRKLKMQAFLFSVFILLQKTCPQVEMRSTLRFSPLGIHNYPSWRCTKPNFYHNVNFLVSLTM